MALSEVVLRHSVKNVYKQLLWASKSYLGGDFEKSRNRLHAAFMKNAKETDLEKIASGINRAEFVLKELETLIYLHKYRTIRKRYSKEALEDPIIDLDKFSDPS